MNRNRPDVPARPGQTHRLRALSGAVAEASSRSHPWSEEQVAEVLAEADRTSIKATSQRTGISAQLISEWRRKRARDLAAATRELVQAGVPLEEVLGEAPSWRTVRLHEADKLAQAAGVIRERALAAALDGNDRLLRAGAIAIDVFIRQAQAILASEPGNGRGRTPEEMERWVTQLQETARARVAAKVKAEADAVGLDTPEESA